MKLPEFLAIGKFSDPSQSTDLEGFEFDGYDIELLKECRLVIVRFRCPPSPSKIFTNQSSGLRPTSTDK
jgi:hypothetical protein